MNLQSQLESGLESLDIPVKPDQIDALLGYLSLLDKWNKSFNLTAIRDANKMLAYHLLDSLSIWRWIPPHARALDVGSGAGLPGIPLAVVLPQTQWKLLDSNGKKTRFMQQALAVCEIKNATVVKSRIEDYHAGQPFDIVVSRAYTSLTAFVQSVAHVMQPETLVMAMKTGLENEESSLDINRYELQECDLKIPGLFEPRKLITVKQN
ncbi:MAG: 16S rRNA (guanine(527)-N(7))-methyltransferase RsmG [Gammaproteobacteria bacterium]|nr:16S rRNA (guanine(527)-N(7))-methyltransferase RsmG [Gammaproteobacteria bacterium]